MRPKQFRRVRARSRWMIVPALLFVLAAIAGADPYSTTGRWTNASPSIAIGDTVNNDRTPIHMALIRGDDDWNTSGGRAANHHHSYLFWWENRDNFCNPPGTGTKPHFHGGLYAWDPPASSYDCSGNMMQAGFTRLSLADSILDPGGEDGGHDIFCGGNALLSTGALAVVGGAGAENSGSVQSAIFDPHVTGRSMWTRTGRLNLPRWYPTIIQQDSSNRMIAYAGLQYAQLHILGGHGTSLSGHPLGWVPHAQLAAGGSWAAESLPDSDTVTVAAPRRPSPRDFSVAPLREDENENPAHAILFGGIDSSATSLKDVWWLKHHVDNGVESQQWFKFTTISGDGPSTGLFGMSAVADVDSSWLHDSKWREHLWVFGGASGSSGKAKTLVYRGKVASRDSREWVWTSMAPTPVAPDTTGPTGRVQASYAYDAKYNRLIVFGGYTTLSPDTVTSDTSVWSLSLEDNPTWKRLTQTTPDRPQALAEASLVAGPDNLEHLSGDKANMYLYGGQSVGGVTSSMKSDVWLLYFPDPDHVTWKQLNIASSPSGPGPRAGAVIARDRNSWFLRVYGGKTPSGLADGKIWRMDIFRDRTVGSCDTDARPWAELGESPSGGRYGAVGVSDAFEIAATTVEARTMSDTTWNKISASGQDRFEEFYPLLFPLPNGHIYDAFARLYGRPTSEFNPTTGAWSQFTASSSNDTLMAFGGGSAVMQSHIDGSMDILKCGPKDVELSPGLAPKGWTAKLKVDRYGGLASTWQTAGVMHPRVFHNLVSLPDSKVLVTGGARINSQGVVDSTSGVTRPQLWDPTTLAWSDSSTLADELVLRGYHSGALMLPTGQVLTGGGNDSVLARMDKHKFKVFCPPQSYSVNTALSQLALQGAPNLVPFEASFRIGLSNAVANTVTRVVLIRPGAPTHGFNSSQAYVEVSFMVCGDGLDCWAPKRYTVPEGDYLIFAQIGGYWTRGDWVRLSGSGSTTYASGGEPVACDPGGGSGGGDDPGEELIGPHSASRAVIGAAARYLDNTLFSGVADGEHATDRLRLPGGPMAIGSGPTVRLRHKAEGHDDIDGVRLVAIDHATGELAHRGATDIVVGSHAPAISCKDAQAVSRLAELQSSEGMWVAPGDVFDVHLSDAHGDDSLLWIESSGHPADDGGIVIEQELASGWQELGVVTPRAKRDAEVLGNLVSSHLRLTALGRHRLFGLGRFTAGPAPTRTALAPLAAERAGHGGFDASQPFSLADGDTALVHFAALDPPADGVRDWFLEVAGTPRGYQPTAVALHARHAPALEPAEHRFIFRLIGGVPNPFAMGTHVLFELPRAGTVRLDVYDAQGRRIRTLGGRFEAERNSVQWNRRTDAGTLAPRGVYFMRLSSGADEANGRLVVL